MVNPTGKEGAFRGADWVEESNNLFIKARHFLFALSMIFMSLSSMTKVAEARIIPRRESWKNRH